MESDNRTENAVYSSYRDEEVEIDLIDLFFDVLKHWRSMIIAGLVCAVIAGAFIYVKESSRPRTGKGSLEEEYALEQKIYEDELAKYNATIEKYESIYNKLDSLNESLERRQRIFDNSIYMSLDPYNVAENVVKWKIILNDDEWKNYHEGMDDPVDEIVATYATAMDSPYDVSTTEMTETYDSTLNKASIDWKAIGSEMGIDPGSIPELVFLDGNLEANQVTLRVYYKDEAGAQKISDMIRQQLEKVWAESDELLPGHSMKQIQALSHITAKTEIEDRRQKQINTINSYIDQINSVKSTLIGTKNPYEEEEPEAPRQGGIPRWVKFSAIGLLAGVFLIAVIFGGAYLLSGCIHTKEEFSGYFRVEVLADKPLEKSRKAFGFVDDLLDRIRGVKYEDDEAVLRRCAIRTGPLLRGKSILLTGTAGSDKIEKLAESMREKLPDIEVKSGKNVTEDNDTLNSITDKTDVIIVEEKKKSKREQIAEEIKYIRGQRGRIIGAVLL